MRDALSAGRIQGRFVLFTTGLLCAITGLIFVLVSQIFSTLTPPLRRDLEQKAIRGAVSVGREGDQALLIGDAALFAKAAKDYERDADIRSIVALNAAEQIVYRYGDPSEPIPRLFRGPARTARPRESDIVAWTSLEIEGAPVGRVALVVSTDRVAAGTRLQARILAVAGAGCLVALLAALSFVKMYVAPILRITHETIEKLEHTTLQALEATRHKSEFLANMSHEIRTPMNGVLAMSELLMRAGLDGRQLRFAEIIRASARALLTIVNDVLDFSKIEAGKYELIPGDFEPRLLLRDVVELLAPRAHAKGVELGFRVAPDVPEVVHADADRFRQILMNLLGNAVKFTEHGEVALSVTLVTCDGDRAILRSEIRDSGPGISQEGLGRLFQTFSQVDASSTRKHGGTGLGLAISRQLATLMGGEIGAVSKPGEGSSFWFTIAAGVVQVERAPDPSASIAFDRRALIVGASTIAREPIEASLTRWGLSHTSCTSTAEAVEALERAVLAGTPFELVLIDAKLESGAGLQLARLIAKGSCPTAVLLLTEGAMIEPGEVAELPEIRRLAKPVRDSELFDFLMDTFHAGRVTHEWPHGRTASHSQGHLLEVDDNEINQVVALELLGELGFTVDVVGNGAEAVEAVKSGRYDGVLMDCQMPIMDGYQAARAIRSWEAETNAKRVPIIAVTAHAIAGEREKVTSAGMDDYLTKPIARSLLESALGRQLGMRGVRPPPHPVEVALPLVRPPNDTACEPPIAAPEVQLDPAIKRSQKLCTLFLDLAPKQIAMLGEAAASDDTAELRARSHKLKGSCASVGAHRMAEVCEAIQHAADRGDRSPAALGCEQLRSLFALTATELRAELASLSSPALPGQRPAP